MQRLLSFHALEERRLLTAPADTVVDLWPGPLHSDVHVLAPYGDDQLVLSGMTPDGAQLFITDGTLEGTQEFHAWDGYGISRYLDGGVDAVHEETGIRYFLGDDGTVSLISDVPYNTWLDGPGLGVYYMLDKTYTKLSDTEVLFTYDYADSAGRTFTFEEVLPCEPLGEGLYHCPHETIGGDLRVHFDDGHGLVVSVAQDVRSGWPRDYFYADGSPDMWVPIENYWRGNPNLTAHFWFRDAMWIHTLDSGLQAADGAPLGAVPQWYSVAGDEVYVGLENTQQIWRVADDGASLELLFDADTYGFEFDTTVMSATLAPDGRMALHLADPVYGDRGFMLDAHGELRQQSGHTLLPEGSVRLGDVLVIPRHYDSIQTGRELTLRRIMAGDANLDGFFNTADLVALMALGEYEDALVGNSHHETGDFNGDGEFDTSDLVEALALGWYEQG